MRGIIAAAVASFIAALVITPLVIRYFRARGFGQTIREDAEHLHAAKAGTPTMGGTAIVLAALVGYLVARMFNVTPTPKGLLVLGTFVGMGMVGFLDDFIKIRLNRNLGLNKTAKFGGQAVIAFLVAYVGPQFAGISRDLSFVRELGFTFPAVLFFIWVFVMLSGTTNAVNLTDGLDGLAAGAAVQVFAVYTIIAFWQVRNPRAYGFRPVETADQLDVAVILAAAMAACAGFLWWNAPPASIFMGDTGALAIGGLLAATALATNTHLLLINLGGLFVIETLSVLIQVFAFRVLGRRPFRMSPLHHHFEMLGWQETTVIVRFWIIAGIGASMALGIFYADFLTRTGNFE